MKIIHKMPLEIHKLLSVLLMGQSLTIMLTSCGNSDSPSSFVNILETLNISTPSTGEPVISSNGIHSHSNWRTHLRSKVHSTPRDNIFSSSSAHSDHSEANTSPWSSNSRLKRTPPESSTNWNQRSSDQSLQWGDLPTHPNIDLSSLPIAYQMTAKLPSKTKKWEKRETAEIKWPNKRVVSVEGDVVIGGLMMVHSRGNGSQTCGQIMGQGGVQALEVMLYTLREINKDKKNPFTVGAHILDDCDTDTYGLAMALDFIKNDGVNKSECSVAAKPSKPIWGVVGAPSSITSIQVSNLLRLFHIPMISPFSTSPELSNKPKFDYFCRTIPSDYYQVQVIATIIDQLNWTYISIIYEESNYGMKGLEELEKVLEGKACIAVKEKLLKDSGVPNEEFLDNVVKSLLSKPHARGVIVFASDEEVAGLMKAVKRQNSIDKFSWIGSDGWSARILVSDGNEEVVEGTISVQPQAKSVHGFDEYFLKQTPAMENPYFAEYWETIFKCRLPYVPRTPFNKDFTQKCNASLRLDGSSVEIEKQLQFVHQATMGFCKALFDMHSHLCGENQTGVCDKMWQNKKSFLLYVKNVTFRDFSDDQFQFDENGDGPARYNIIHYKRVALDQYEWKQIGRYGNGKLDFNMTDLRFKWNNTQMPASNCSYKCNKGFHKKYHETDKCCWTCIECGKYEIVLPKNDTSCTICNIPTMPNSDRKKCVNITNIVSRNKFFNVSIAGTTSLGVINVMCTFSIYVYDFNSHTVKGSSREAQILILIGALALHINAYSFTLDPNEFVCSIQSYLSGIGYVLIYGSLFWKSYRIVRVFDLSKPCKNLNSSVFVLLVLGLCCIQKIESVIWTHFVDPRQVNDLFPTRESKIRVCSAFTKIQMGYLIAYIFPLINIVFCYARTREIKPETPERFHYSNHIFFSIYFTIISWAIMLIIHFTTEDIPLRQNALALITNLNGIVVVFVLSFKSLYYILFPSKAPKDEKPFPRAKEIGTQFPSSSDTTLSSPLLQKALVSTCYNNENRTVLVNDANEIPKISQAVMTTETPNGMNGSARRDQECIGFAKNLPSKRTVLSFRNEKGPEMFSNSGAYEMGSTKGSNLDAFMYEKAIKPRISDAPCYL